MAANVLPACSVSDTGPQLSLPVNVQVVNDYENNVFNGDQGFVTKITAGSTPSMEVSFPPSSTVITSAPELRVFEYSGRELDVLDLAWATTVHKAQGGEAKAVLLALSPSHRPLLSRRLLYTGERLHIPRASALCCPSQPQPGDQPTIKTTAEGCLDCVVTPSGVCSHQMVSGR